MPGSSFRGKVLFRDRNFGTLFDFTTDRHYDFGTFNPGNTDKLVVLFAGATICIVDYSLGGSTGTLGNCKKTYGLQYQLKFIGPDKLVGYYQSTLMTFDYPSLNLRTKYSVQPVYAERAYNTIYHYHVFPNYKLMRFNRLTLQNDPSVPIY